MKLSNDELPKHLKTNLLPIYWVSGDDLFLSLEAQDRIRTAAKKNGYDERQIITTQAHMNLEEAFKDTHNLSLFSSKKIVELRITQEKVNATYGKAILEFAQKKFDDICLLISSKKLDASTTSTKWYTSLEKLGAVIPIWPIDYHALPRWIENRLREHHLPTDPTLIQLIQERTAGNLMAAAQTIEKCALLYLSEPKDVQRLIDSISDQSRFTVFEWLDSLLLGDGKRCVHILQRLKMEGEEPMGLVWALARELRLLAKIRFQIGQKTPFDAIMKSLFIWPKRQGLLKLYLKRNKLSDIYTQLQHVASIDRMIKGFESGDVWIHLSQLSLQMAGATRV